MLSPDSILKSRIPGNSNLRAGTLSATAQQIFSDAFPARSSETAMVVLVTASVPNATQIVMPGGFVAGLTAYLNSSLVRTQAQYENVWTGEFVGYFTVIGTPLDAAKGKFVSPTGSATFMSISVRSTVRRVGHGRRG